MAVRRLESRYYKALDSILTAGGKRQMENGAEVIKNYSPNNLRRLVLGLDGIFAQFYVSNGVTKTEHLQVLTMTDKLTEEVCNPNSQYKAPLNLLRGLGGSTRVYSSVEEVIILERNPNFPHPFLNTGLNWFLGDSFASTSFKRLRCVTIIKEPVTIQQFLTEANGYLKDPLVTLTERTSFQKDGKMLAGADYLLHTALRPQFYDLDNKDGRLDKHFTHVKELYQKAQVDKAKSKLEKPAKDYSGLIKKLKGYQVKLKDKALPAGLGNSDYLTNMATLVKNELSAMAEAGWDMEVAVKRSNSDFDLIEFFLSVLEKNKPDLTPAQLTTIRRVAYNLGYLLTAVSAKMAYSRSLKKALDGLATDLTEDSIDTLNSLVDSIEAEPELVSEEVEGEGGFDTELLSKIIDYCLSLGISYENDIEFSGGKPEKVSEQELNSYKTHLTAEDLYSAVQMMGLAIKTSSVYALVQGGTTIEDAVFLVSAKTWVSEAYGSEGSNLTSLAVKVLPDLDKWNSLKQGTPETGAVRPTLEPIYTAVDELVNNCTNLISAFYFRNNVVVILANLLKNPEVAIPFSIKSAEKADFLGHDTNKGLKGIPDEVSAKDLVADLYKTIKMKVPKKSRDIGAIFERAMKRAGGIE